MSLINRERATLIAPCCAGTLLDLDESTLRKGQSGTGNPTRVRHGGGKRQRVHFILEEVISLKIERIEAARKRDGKVLRLVAR